MATLAVSISAALLKPVIAKLSSEAWQNLSLFWHIEGKCDNLKNMLTAISTILTDAEKKSITDELIHHWLLQLQDVAYDIDDLLDSIQIEAKRRSKRKPPVSAVQDFFSSDNQVKFRTGMVKKLKKIITRLGKIMEEKKTFKLVEGDALMEEDKTKRVTTSAVNESKVYGRNQEKKFLIDHVIHGRNNEILSVLPIWGMGGVGKTTLAQIICNDPQITKHFKPIIWVHVPMNFELSKILHNLVECSGEKCDVSEKEAVKNKLQAVISKTKFLVVLDDVWNEDVKKWEDLETILSCGEAGSKILVTTRSERVADIMRTLNPFHLNPLKFDDCWELFKKRAFRNINEDENPNLVDIGKKIVEKCKGLPLATEHLGNLAGSRKVEWSVIRDNEIWQIEKHFEKEVNIVPSLLLSYFYLPSHLKRCFAYCSLFPKGFLFRKKYLSQLWTCESFIPKMKLEANSCFDDLLSQSFFVDRKNTEWSQGPYIMHDLIHDLACYVAGDKFFLRSESEKSQNTGSWRYSSAWLNDFTGIKKLRSLICPDHMDLPKKLDSIMKLQFLRVLDINYKIGVLPDSIGNLRHLRYLNISAGNQNLKMLPNSVTALLSLEVLDLSGCIELSMLRMSLGALQNLEVLNLSQCYSLKNLPKSVCSLTNLKVLNLTECLQLVSIPKGIGKLTKLESLPLLIIDGDEGCTFGELQHLNLLKHTMEIVVEKKRGLPGISKPKLETKKNLKSLKIEVKVQESDAKLLIQIGSLKLPSHLENLCINWAFSLWEQSVLGFDLPCSLRTTDYHLIYKNLINVELHGINECECFPQFGQVPRLKLLHLSLRFTITKIKEHFSGYYGMYPVLEELKLFEVCNVIATKEVAVETEVMRMMFPCLKKVRFEDCPFISVFPFIPSSIENLCIKGNCGQDILSTRSLQGLNQLRKLELLDISNEFNTFDGIRYLTALEELEICYGVRFSLPPSLLHHLPSIKSLTIAGMPKLQLLEEERVVIGGDTSSRYQPPPPFAKLQSLKITVCDSLRGLPGWLGSLPFLQSLEVRYCPKLIEFPESFEHLTSLQYLGLRDLPHLQKLPRGTEQLASIQNLSIIDCSELSKQYRVQWCKKRSVYYKREEGGHWHKISHIRGINICPIEELTEGGAGIEDLAS